MNNQQIQNINQLNSELPQIQQGRLRLKFDGTGYLSNADNLNFFPFSFKDTNYSIVFTITAVRNDTVRMHGTCFFVEDKTINGAKLNIYNKDQNYISSDWADVDWIAIRNS